MRIIDDLTEMETLTFLGKVSDIAKASEDAGKAHIKKVFDTTYLLSVKKACHSVAILMKWTDLARCFADELNQTTAGREVSNG